MFTSLDEVSTLVSPEEYLRLEREAEFKHDYFAGVVQTRPEVSFAHNRISANLSGALGRQLRGTNCAAVGSNQRLFIEAAATFCYPDLAVVCGKPAFLDDTTDTLLHPTLLVQIVPPGPGCD